MSQRTGNNANGNGGHLTLATQERVVDFSEIRAQKLEEKRRTTERIFFKHLLSVYSVVGDSTMRPIEFIEVSEEGCSFQVPYDAEKPWPTDAANLPLRIYFSQDTYLEIQVAIQNSSRTIDRRFVRYGCTVDKTTKSYDAYRQFVRFLKAYSEHAHKDMGDVTVFYL